MKINLYNMKGLADWIGGADSPTMDEINIIVTAGTIYKMAYQLQHFFEAMEKIDTKGNQGPTYTNDQHKCGMSFAYNKSLTILKNALIHKEDEYTLDA